MAIGYNFKKNAAFLSLKMDIVLANYADSVEMLPYVAFPWMKVQKIPKS